MFLMVIDVVHIVIGNRKIESGEKRREKCR